MNTWIVCHRNFDHGTLGVSAFTTEDRAYLHAARLIAEVCGMDANGPQLVAALQDGRYEEAVRLYHQVGGNFDRIDVTCAQLDELHSDEPLQLATIK